MKLIPCPAGHGEDSEPLTLCGSGCPTKGILALQKQGFIPTLYIVSPEPLEIFCLYTVSFEIVWSTVLDQRIALVTIPLNLVK